MSQQFSPIFCSWFPLFHRKKLLSRNNCSDLNENGPYRLRCFDTWSPLGGAIWVGLAEVSSLKEVCHLEWAWRFQSYVCSSSLSGLWIWVQYMSSCCSSCQPAAVMPPAVLVRDLYASGTVTPSYKLLWSWIVITAIEK